MGWCSFWRDCIVPSIFGGAYQTNCQLLVGGPWDFLIHNVQLSFPAKPSNTCCGDFWIRQFLGTFSEADSLAYGCEIYDGSLNTAVINLPYPTNYTPDISSEGTWIRKVKYLKYLKSWQRLGHLRCRNSWHFGPQLSSWHFKCQPSEQYLAMDDALRRPWVLLWKMIKCSPGNDIFKFINI